MSSVNEVMPGFAAVVWSSACLRRPAMTTWFPKLWKASARPRPMPEPPPVIRIVLPVVFMAIILPEHPLSDHCLQQGAQPVPQNLNPDADQDERRHAEDDVHRRIAQRSPQPLREPVAQIDGRRNQNRAQQHPYDQSP